MLSVINRFGQVCAFAVLVTAAGCGGLLEPPDRSAIERLWVSHSGLVVQQGERISVSATYRRDRESGIRPADAAEWTVSDTSVLAVEAPGVVRARTAGRATIYVRLGGLVDSAEVAVHGTEPQFTTTWRRVSAGEHTVCALDDAGGAIEWAPLPLEEDPGFSRLALGGSTSCGLTADGRAYCWGSNYTGLLGVSETGERCGPPGSEASCSRRPLPVAPELRFADLTVGGLVACGVTLEGALYCWGSNREGQLGNGRIVATSLAPVRVADPIHE